MTANPATVSEYDPHADAGALVRQVGALGVFLKLHATDPLPSTTSEGWIAEEDLERTADDPQLSLLERLATHGFGGSKRALSASVMLRYGWSSGILIGPWLMAGAVIRGASLALRFSANAVLTDVALRSHAGVVTSAQTSPDSLRRMLVHELISRASPIIDAHHRWSGFSRKALWAMATSSWGAQFANIAERLGDPERGLTEARAVLAVNPEIEAAAPDIYMVRSGGRHGLCQMRRLCCLWFKTPQRQFCASCPIIPAEERMERNHRWIAQRGLADNTQTERT